jgi:hypothetical protein
MTEIDRIVDAMVLGHQAEAERLLKSSSLNPTQQIGAVIVGAVKTALKQRDATIERLEQRIKTLEAQPVIKYQGTHDPTRQYNEGDMLTHRGNVWHCNRSTRATPGESPDFTLAIRAGRDGKR